MDEHLFPCIDPCVLRLEEDNKVLTGASGDVCEKISEQIMTTRCPAGMNNKYVKGSEATGGLQSKIEKMQMQHMPSTNIPYEPFGGLQYPSGDWNYLNRLPGEHRNGHCSTEKWPGHVWDPCGGDTTARQPAGGHSQAAR